jgi:hypothetical protein
MAKTGRRVQIYIPGDLLEQWDALPRYERSAAVAAALRAWWETQPANEAKKEPGRTPTARDDRAE